MSTLEKVLITGGAGFIGSHTADLLLEEGVKVRVLDNLTTGNLDNLPLDHPMLEFVEGDIKSINAVSEAMQGVSHCLHLAAQVSVVKSIEEPVNSSETNVQGFLHVLDAARQARVKRLVYASSAAVYGVPVCLPLDEQALTKPISPYGLEKLIDEKYANLYSELYGVSTLGLRYFNVYGPRQDPSSPYSGVISIFTKNIREGKNVKIFGDGSQTRDFIYIRDVAKTNVQALKSDLNLACNVATGSSVSLVQLVEILNEIGGETNIDFYPAREGDIPDSSVNPALALESLGVELPTELKMGLKILWENM